jgi:heme a synthase
MGGANGVQTLEPRPGAETVRPDSPSHLVTLSPCHLVTNVPRWLHAWAVLTVCAALPLVSLGAEVTTKQVGMVDRVGFRAPWHLLSVPVSEAGRGYLIEHGHRLAGFVVGTCCIVLALGLTVAGRGWYRWLGWLALAAVGVQGLLGIFRVNLHALLGPWLAFVHGCFAQVTFATLVAVAVLTSRAWAKAPHVAGLGGLRRLALGLAALVYAQAAFGAMVRHLLDRTAQRAHLALAFVVVVVACWLVRWLWQEARGDRALRGAAVVLAGLIVVQPLLGVEAWIRRFGSATLPELTPSSFALDLVRSGHHVVGTLLFATSVAVALLLFRPGARARVGGAA